MRKYLLRSLPLVLATSVVVVVAMAMRQKQDQTRSRRVTNTSSREIKVKAGGDLQAAINQAQYGDTIILDTGEVYESPKGKPFVLPDKGAGTGTDSDYITIRSSSVLSLPENERVTPKSASLMAKVVANASPTLFELKKSAHHYKFVGLEMTNKDASGVHTHSLVSSEFYLPQGVYPHHVVIDRSYLHPIEETTNPTSLARSLTRGVFIDGAEITISNSYLAGFAGTYRYSSGVIDSECFLVVAGPGPYHILNNYLEAWYANFFLGGGPRPAIAANTGAVQPGATLLSASLSSTNNLNVGDMITFTQPAGENANAQVLSKNGNNITFTSLYKFDPGCNCQVPATPPSPGTQAAWNGQQINGVEIKGNTIFKNPAHKGNGISDPKGYFEAKNGNNITIDGNVFEGYPTTLAFTSRNDRGSNPWSTISNLVITNNRIHGYKEAFILLMKDDYSLGAQSTGLIISNNLITPGNAPLADATYDHYKFADIQSGSNVQISHNTIIGNRTTIVSAARPTSEMVFRDNIVENGSYGFACFLSPNSMSTCWPGLKMPRNIIIDTRDDKSSPLVYPGASYFVTSTQAVGFNNSQNGDYSLGANSRFKGKASDGKDVGVDVSLLQTRSQETGGRQSAANGSF